MAINILTGKPGAGKGVYATKLIIDEITLGKRPIITNLAIKLEPWVNGRGEAQIGLRGFLQSRYKNTFDIDNRLWVLTDEEVPNFFCYRVGETGARSIAELRTDKNGKETEFDTEQGAKSGGAYYVLDEGWKFWSARNWKDTGAPVLFYAAQHRKLGDEVVIATQHPKQLETALRQVAQSFVQVRNHGKERFGMFRQPDAFSVSTFSEMPTANSAAQCRSVFKLDVKGIGGCFDTSAGVGVSGQAPADMGERRKGIKAKWLIPVGIVAACLVFFIPWTLSKGITKFVTKKSAPKVTGGLQSAQKFAIGEVFGVTNSPVEQKHAAPSLISTQAPERVLRQPGEFLKPVPPLPEEEVYLSGLNQLPDGRVFVFLSDGQQFTVGDPELQLVTPKFVVVLGRVYRWPSASVVSTRPDERNGVPVRSPLSLGSVSPKTWVGASDRRMGGPYRRVQ